MGFGANFTKVTLGKNGQGAGVLQVEGKSDAEVRRRVSQMHVALVLSPEVMLPANGGKPGTAAAAPRRASVASANESAAWRVGVPQDAPLPKAGTNVLVLGAAVLKPATRKADTKPDLFYWSTILPLDA
jgi:hypothetical protein